MVRIFIAFLIITVAYNPLRSQTPSPDIAFRERVYNFDTILEEKGKVSHIFVFENKGKKPVTIDDIYSTCGCIGKFISKGPVKPGAKGKVTITFDPGYKSGFFSKEIMVYSNNRQHYSRIWVEGVIKPAEHPIEEEYPYNFGAGLYLRLKVVAFGYVKPGETKQVQLHYANGTDKELNVDFVAAADKAGLKFTSPGKIKAKARGVITIAYTMPVASKEDVIVDLYPYVNNKKLAAAVTVKILNELNLNKSKPAIQPPGGR